MIIYLMQVKVVAYDCATTFKAACTEDSGLGVRGERLHSCNGDEQRGNSLR